MADSIKSCNSLSLHSHVTLEQSLLNDTKYFCHAAGILWFLEAFSSQDEPKDCVRAGRYTLYILSSQHVYCRTKEVVLNVISYIDIWKRY